MSDSKTSQDSSIYPVLPLRDVVVFPSMIFPLLIGRAGTLAAVEKAMVMERKILLLSQHDANKEDVSPEDLYQVGVISSILQTLKLPNGLVKVLVEGLQRARVTNMSTDQECLMAETEPLDLIEPDSLGTRAHMNVATRIFREYVNLNRQLPDEVLMTLSNLTSPESVADFIMAHLPLSSTKKQEILEESSLPEQFKNINKVLDQEIEILKIEHNIEGQVKDKISRTQRNFFLQEQMRIIKKELGEDTEEDFSDVIAYRKKIRKARMPKAVRERADEELEKLKGMPMMSPEATVIKNFLDWVCALPWSVKTTDTLDLDIAEKILDEDHYGLRKPKERILEHLAVLSRVDKIKGPILCLVGPPGVGKTSLARSIARSMNRKFVRLSLGGIRDEAEIRGHRRTYIGSMPGRIIQGMRRAGSINPVFLLDEVDKMAADFRGDPSSALLEVLDPEQNFSFSDHYLEVGFDLSNVLFITTANIRHEIPLPLQDRMEIIEVHGYLEHEKLQIATNFLLPKQVKENGLKKSELVLPHESIDRVIDEYTRESGVRELERMLARICRKIARENVNGETKSIRVTPATLEKYLGIPRYKENQVEKGDRIGTAVGLAWTSVGGDILNIQANVMKGKGAIQMTGRLGDVMKESAHAAVSFLRSNGADWGIAPDFVAKQDIHFHIPEAATPKDGPSAGITMATALLSALTGKPVPADVAMTGEITLRGNVLPIGGLAEKIMAAKRAGISRLFIPSENRVNWTDLDDELRKDMNVFFVENVIEVWQEIFPAKKSKSSGKGRRKSTRAARTSPAGSH
ncbi:endopeptidase La [bacterium]|nr:endopeptidase La [bacterium]